ncbi:WD40 repeat-like protein [Suillus decipiens]|nr:WD40 repeat-like protein [Suillus decipiens]
MRWRWSKQSHSEPHLVQERGRSPASQDLSPLSPSGNGSTGRPPGLVRKLAGKMAMRFTRSARQSPNPEHTAAGSSSQDIQPIQSTEEVTTSTLEPNPEPSSNSGIVEPSSTNKVVNKAIANASKGLADIGQVPTIVQHASSMSADIPSVSGAIDTFSVFLKSLKAFNTVANEIANIHPYAKAALSIFTCASTRNSTFALRLTKLYRLSEVYTFITEDEELTKIQSMVAVYEKIAQQTLECADFISHYSETKSAWMRLGKHVFDETDATIRSYNNVLDSLMQQFRDKAARDTVVIVHHIADSLDLFGMECATGAGLNPSKCCLPDTRQDLLKDIQNWIRSTEAGTPQVLWLSGTAGKGKSAVAHTIAKWHIENGGVGACFCFDRTQQASRGQDKVFRTMARDLADCNPIVRRALAQAVRDRDGLKRTPDIMKQWQELIVGPTNMIASKGIAAPVLMIIEALDESGEADSREQIIRLLAGRLNTSNSQPVELPANFRILLTSRPLKDIHNKLHGPHVRNVSLDGVSSVSTELDIQRYISHKLEDLHIFNDVHFKKLALKSDGLFEWARLTCDYIKGTNRIGLGPIERFNDVCTGISGTGTQLLDDMYERILTDIIPVKERRQAIPVFRSVMGQILASSEPLPMSALTAMRRNFSSAQGRYEVDWVVGPLSSLLSGTTDPHTPIRPLHASFYDFLTDESRSGHFFVDRSSVQGDLAFASLRVMERGLRFNICSLENSYLPNSSVPDLEKRVKESIPVELSYSCRFWGTHVTATSFESLLAKEVEAFFDEERLLWWLEALALMKSLSGSVATLSCIANWISGHGEFTHVSEAVRDTLRFIRTFASTILRSTPHLYLSALPFAPTQSRMFRKFASKFGCTPRIVAGHVENWPEMEKILHANGVVFSVALSPDGKCIACGLVDCTIQVWDMDTGEALCAPLRGHTGHVWSVAFSPDGRRIVSGSWDCTVRVWDAKTGEALGSPLKGHTDFVRSVAISPDGRRIVSGSHDRTIRVWDMETGEAFGSPLKGHTDYVRSVAISSDGRRIVSGSDDMMIRVWDMETGDALGTPLQGHTALILSITISPDGKYIVSVSYDKTIRVWDMETGEAFGAPLQGHTGSVGSVAIFLDGTRIVSGSEDQTIRVWDVKTGVALGFPLQGHSHYVSSVTISPDGSRIVSGSWDKTIRVWDADIIMGKTSVATLESHTGSVNSVAISPDGCSIVSGSNDTTVRVWDIETGKALVAPIRGHAESVLSVAMSPDGKGVVSGSADKSIRMWNLETGDVLAVSLEAHTSDVLSVAISPDRNSIVSGSSDETIRVWDIETGEAYHLSGHSDRIWSVAISSDGNRIVSGSFDKTIGVWDMVTRNVLCAPLQGHTDYVLSVAISPDVCHIVSGSLDKTIRVWDMGTGKPLGAPLEGHTAGVNTVAISSDGNRIVSGSTDQTVRVWDMKTGKAVGPPFRGHTAVVWSVAISRDGKRIVSGSEDTTIRVWDVEFLGRRQSFEAPAMCFSLNPIHALCSASSFLQDSKIPASSSPNEEGWIVSPEGRLLLCIPLNFHPVVYTPGTMLVIANNPLQLDLSCVAHGTSWHQCWEQ